MSGINFNDTTAKAYRVGGTDVAVADGGTGSSTASDARTALGLAIGTDVQAFDADLSALAGIGTNGILVHTGAGTAAARTITGTASLITVTDGDGVAGNPTITVGANVYVSGGTDVAVADGGTGVSTTPSNGQLLIGNGTGYTVANLTAGSNVSITNGAGSITIAATLANSTLDLNRTTVADADYTVLTADMIIGITSITAARTLTLPAAATATAGKVFFIKDESGSVTSSNTIIIDGNGAETIDGQTSITIDVAYGCARIYCTGSAWMTL